MAGRVSPFSACYSPRTVAQFQTVLEYQRGLLYRPAMLDLREQLVTRPIPEG